MEKLTKTAVCINILRYLSAHKGTFIKRIDIANEFGITERQAMAYVKTIADSGFQIESKQGQDGGYKMMSYNSFSIPASKIGEKDILELKQAVSAWVKHYDGSDLDKVYEMIFANSNKLEADNTYIVDSTSKMTSQHLDILGYFNSAINNDRLIQVDLLFESQYANYLTAYIKPIGIIHTKDTISLLVLNKFAKKDEYSDYQSINLFHVLDIKEGEHFTDDNAYNIEKIYSNIEESSAMVDVELHLTRKGAKILYGLDTGLTNEKLDFIENDLVLYSCSVQGKLDILRILTYIPGQIKGIIKPIEYKSIIKDELEKILTSL